MISEVLAAAGGLGMAVVPAAVLLRRMQARLREVGEAYELARHEATHDSLTGLANRRAFYDLAATAVAAASPERPLAVALVDVDKFKNINDTHGHGVGDLVLHSVARQLAARVPNGLVARLGGDEYAVLVELRHGESAVLLGEVLAASSEDVDVDVPDLVVTFSVGVAELFSPADLTDALHCADAALYRSKQTSRVEVHVPGRDDDVAVQQRPLLRTRDLDAAPVPAVAELGGVR